MATLKFEGTDKLLLDVMRRQSGTIQKACLEGVMNSIEAGATKVNITIDHRKIVIEDDGRGFRSLEEIHSWFKRLGQEHSASEGKIWAEFRIGRGQLFNFGRNIWTSGTFVLDVDLEKKGLFFDADDGHPFRKGCHILIELYKPLTVRDIFTIKTELASLVKYVSIPVYVNEKQVNTPPEDESWTLTNKDAYCRFSSAKDLKVYNLGVFVCALPSWQVGTGGVVVSRQRLQVNFARNDIQSSCPVWKRIREVLPKDLAEKATKRALTEDEIVYLYQELLAGEGTYATEAAKIFKDVSGKLWSYKAIRKKNFTHFSVAKSGDVAGDGLIERELCLVLDEEFLETCGIDDPKDLFKVIAGNYCFRHPPVYIDYEEAVERLNSTFNTIAIDKLTTAERVWKDVAETALCNFIYGWTFKEYVEVEDEMDRYELSQSLHRKILIGNGPADGWTDGASYIAISREFLKKLNIEKYGAVNPQAVLELCMLLLHELIHDGDSTTQVHSLEFYKSYHDKHKLLSFVFQKVLACLPPKALDRMREKHKKGAKVTTECVDMPAPEAAEVGA